MKLNQKDQLKYARQSSAYVCSSFVAELVDNMVEVQQEDRLFFQEIERCKEYIREVQEEVFYDWRAEATPVELAHIEDKPYFASQSTLKAKLLNMQQEAVVPKKSHSLFSRRSFSSSIKQRQSMSNISEWGQLRFSMLRQQTQSRLKLRNASKVNNFQKLQINRNQRDEQEQKFIKQYFSQQKIKNETVVKRKHRKVHLVQKNKQNNEDDSQIPLLLKMNYEVTDDRSKNRVNSQNQNVKQFTISQKKIMNHRTKHKTIHSGNQKYENLVKLPTKTETNKLKLKSRQDTPKIKSQIVVNDWNIFNQVIQKKSKILANEVNGRRYSKLSVSTQNNSGLNSKRSSVCIYIPQY